MSDTIIVSVDGEDGNSAVEEAEEFDDLQVGATEFIGSQWQGTNILKQRRPRTIP